jgi:hypothetical protein
MMKDELAALWSLRRAALDEINANAERYKECEQCRAIPVKRSAVCPWCGAYRFLENPERVRATVREMGMRPFPLAAPVMPRSALSSGEHCGMLLGKLGKRVEFLAEDTSDILE